MPDSGVYVLRHLPPRSPWDAFSPARWQVLCPKGAETEVRLYLDEELLERRPALARTDLVLERPLFEARCYRVELGPPEAPLVKTILWVEGPLHVDHRQLGRRVRSWFR